MPTHRIRDACLLGQILGCRVVEVTDIDPDEQAERGATVFLHFDNGVTLEFPLAEGGFRILNPLVASEDDSA